MWRAYELRDDVTVHDAACVALAEALRCALVTADARLARASGVRCEVELVAQPLTAGPGREPGRAT